METLNTSSFSFTINMDYKKLRFKAQDISTLNLKP